MGVTLIVVIVVVATSRTAPAPSLEQIRGLTMKTIDREVVRASWNRTDVVATTIIGLLIATVYLYFSFWV